MTPHKAIQSLQILLRFFQLLCENHNNSLQNMLREQITVEGNINSKSFDFMTQIAKIFIVYYKIFSARTCNLGYQIVDCLIEFIQGPCHLNQKAPITAKIIDSSRDFIAGFDKEIDYKPLGFTSEAEDQENISVFKKKIVTLLLSLLEGETDMEIITRMSHYLDFGVIKDRMQVVFHSFVKKLLKDDNLSLASISLGIIDNRL